MIKDNEPKPEVAAIILAAGASTRMGQAKQLMTIDGRPMVRRVTEMVCSSGLSQVAVVTGARAEAVGLALQGLPIDIIVNQEWAQGLSTSVRAGIGALRPEIQAAMIILADQPTLTSQLLRALVERYAETRALIVAPFFQGKRGNPVIFDRSLFPELQLVEGDSGGRTVLLKYQDKLARLEVDQPAILTDVDTPEDFARLQNKRDSDGHG